ncbi:hypothetical protein CEXT_385731 [Caerostris extrusa]|uniref:Uncharacterized protein n=1 Tax=Caerostris extrusa TaxID=172846 RepID=A0AAV4WDF7_CAEEX|nr:hypothetical protein CEXT_385731 [Caerostris extrusa]
MSVDIPLLFLKSSTQQQFVSFDVSAPNSGNLERTPRVINVSSRYHLPPKQPNMQKKKKKKVGKKNQEAKKRQKKKLHSELAAEVSAVKRCTNKKGAHRFPNQLIK